MNTRSNKLQNSLKNLLAAMLDCPKRSLETCMVYGVSSCSSYDSNSIIS